MKVKDIYEFIDSFAPFDTCVEGDNAGLLIGDTENVVNKVLVCLDLLPNTAQRAIEIGADLIVSHHPFIYEPLCSITTESMAGKTALILARHGISAIAAHTNLDMAEKGVNYHLARILKLKNIERIIPCNGAFEGIMGEIDSRIENEMSLSVFKQYVKDALNSDAVMTYSAGRTVKRIALVSGSGGSCAEKCAEYGVDTFLTGEMKYHAALEAAFTGMNIVTAGHYETENHICRVLAGEIEKLGVTVEL